MSDTNAVPGIYATRLIDTEAGFVPAVVNVNPTTGARVVPDDELMIPWSAANG